MLKGKWKDFFKNNNVIFKIISAANDNENHWGQFWSIFLKRFLVNNYDGFFLFAQS